MIKKNRRFAATLVSATAVFAALSAPAQAADTSRADAGALSCYDTAFWYEAEAGTSASDNAHYPDRGVWKVVDSDCNDINIAPHSSRWVRVCTHNKCHGWVWAEQGRWTVIFHNSVYGAEYYLQFNGRSTNSGWLAD
ncbi:hypothetical protein PV415_23040 [Streptomyces sp. ME03-5684b]|uniref:hypothetical protein n=1 Tax=Streptomyces sp. ME03-5684b TaxID=3028681 RepID=UPI0029AAB0AA|nr:hypothetical protein [Streptomyces sp. ME03-5684b]MDX3319784.1 hypothetical protein [Streptomyces sp. ME03-5684b]